jgi:hypothetical protein
MRFHLKASVLIAICAASLFGQPPSTMGVTAGPNGPVGTAHFSAAMSFGPAVTGAPYSAEQVSEHVQTLADGTHITQRQDLMKIYRDSLGRTREERPLFRNVLVSGQAAETRVVVNINDPVAQVRYTLDTVNKVAHRQRLLSPQERPVRSAIGATVVRSGVMGGSISATGVATSTASVGGGAGYIGQQPVEKRPETSTEKLGTQTIEGVLAEGTRHTTTWPVNSQGNDRPISTVSEMWMSPELHVLILSKSNDPRSGESTQKLINISRDEPPASLFQPPPEYTEVDEEGDFTITWGSR